MSNSIQSIENRGARAINASGSPSTLPPKISLYPDSETAFYDFGWRTMRPMFRGGQYDSPRRHNFGVLHVFNQGTIQPSGGYPMHPHENMEIVTIPIKGRWEHKDTDGNLIHFGDGEVQIMSAGTGMAHSEFNASNTDTLTTMQFWLHTNEPNAAPRYEWYRYADKLQQNRLMTIVQPLRSEAGENNVAQGARIHQEAWFSIGCFDQNADVSYVLHGKNHGVFVYVIRGKFLIEGNALGPNDAIGIENIHHVVGRALNPDAQLLLVEVPVNH